MNVCDGTRQNYMNVDYLFLQFVMYVRFLTINNEKKLLYAIEYIDTSRFLLYFSFLPFFFFFFEWK